MLGIVSWAETYNFSFLLSHSITHTFLVEWNCILYTCRTQKQSNNDVAEKGQGMEAQCYKQIYFFLAYLCFICFGTSLCVIPYPLDKWNNKGGLPGERNHNFDSSSWSSFFSQRSRGATTFSVTCTPCDMHVSDTVLRAQHALPFPE